jgi:hypothetical protein
VRRRSALGALCVLACGPARVMPPDAPAPALGDPADAIPGDLDVALRIDLARIRGTVGSTLIEALRSRAGSTGADAGSERLLSDALAAADAVWIAFRPGLAPEHTDNVVILRGNFARIDPRSYPASPKFRGPADLGGGWLLYERDTPKGRALPARMYLRDASIAVFVSTAEIDSVERSLELSMDDAHVEPPAEGVISVEARAPALAEGLLTRAPAAAKLLQRGEKLSAHADLGALGLRAELELVLDSEEGARETAEAAALFARALADEGGDVAAFVKGLRIEAVGKSVVARLALSDRELADLLPRAVH